CFFTEPRRTVTYSLSLHDAPPIFRLAGSTDSFDWLIGGFVAMEDLSRDDSYFYGADYTPYMSLLFSASLNAVNPALPISPSILGDRKSTRLNSSHVKISYAVFCLK